MRKLLLEARARDSLEDPRRTVVLTRHLRPPPTQGTLTSASKRLEDCPPPLSVAETGLMHMQTHSLASPTLAYLNLLVLTQALVTDPCLLASRRRKNLFLPRHLYSGSPV